MGRGNGKSALVAAVAAAVVDPVGPLHGNRREVIVVASSFAQSRIIFEDVLSFLRSPHQDRPGYDLSDRSIWRNQDSANYATIEFRQSGARLRCIGSDPKRAHGLRPFLALLDEPAQWDSAKSEKMLAAIRTGLGKMPGSKLVALGTQAADPVHWFSKMLGGAGVGYSQLHAARDGNPDFRLTTIRRANPSHDHLPSLAAELQSEIVAAKSDAAHLASWRALRLNMGVSDTEMRMLLDPGTWAAVEGDAASDGHPIWGLDLGTSAAQSAVASYWRSGRLEVMAAFPSTPSLAERGLRDGVSRLYVDCYNRGELIQTGGAATDIRALLEEALARYGRPSAIACDRWREAELRDVLAAMSFPRASLEVRGQGFLDGGADVRAFQRAVTEGRVTPLPSLLLRSAMAEARLLVDPAGNQKLSKGSEGGRRMRARDDACAAAILAVACGVRRFAAGAAPRRIYHGTA